MKSTILVIGALPSSLVNLRGALIKDLISNGYNVSVAANDIFSDRDTCNFFQDIGVKTYSIPISRAGLNPLSEISTLISIIKLYKSLKPNIVLAYTVKPVVWGGIASYFSKKLNFFALITGLGYAFTGKAQGKRLIIQSITRILYKIGLINADSVIFQNPDDESEFRQSKLINKTKKTLVVNGSGVDLLKFKMSDFPEGEFKFLMIARLLGDKGVREYVEAGKIINQSKPNVEFHLVGPEDLNPDGISQREINAWKNLPWLTLHGNAKDVRKFIGESHVYVLPSYREGTPRTSLEAMSMGRPIITTDVPGCRETVIPNYNGYLIPVKDVSSLVRAMKEFIDQPNTVTVMGLNSRRLAEKKYDVHKVNKSIMNEIKIIVDKLS